MRIMEIISGTAVNGAVVNCLEICRALSRRGHDVTLVCRPNAWISRQLQDDPVRVIESSLSRWPTTELRRIANIIQEDEIEVVHTHMSSANFFGVLLRLFYRVPACVATAHSRYIQLHWMFNDRVIAVSEATRRFHQRFNFVSRKRIDVIHNFINDLRFSRVPAATRQEVRRELGLTETQPVMAAIGDVIPRKGLIYLVRALPSILDEVPDAQLICVGNDQSEYAERVRGEAERLGVRERITWLGSRDDIERILSAIDVYVLPSLEENMPLAILEAMASGRPVVATAVGGVPECITDQQTGLLVPPAEVEPLAAAMIRLLTHADQRRKMGAAGRARVRANFSIDSQIKRVERAFERAAA